MPRIKFEEYAQNVETCRQTLINNAKSLKLNATDNLTLIEAVQTNVNYIGGTKPLDKYVTRFYDADGTLLQEEYISPGGSVTPPPAPNLDPEYLEFNRWVSAIGEQFDNLQHPVEYGANYRTKDNKSYYFIKLWKDIHLEPISFKFYGGYYSTSKTLYIDWGDGSGIESIYFSSKYMTATHQYTQYGDYVIKIGCPEGNLYDFYPVRQTSSNWISSKLDEIIQKMYLYNFSLYTNEIIPSTTYFPVIAYKHSSWNSQIFLERLKYQPIIILSCDEDGGGLSSLFFSESAYKDRAIILDSNLNGSINGGALINHDVLITPKNMALTFSLTGSYRPDTHIYHLGRFMGTNSLNMYVTNSGTPYRAAYYYFTEEPVFTFAGSSSSGYYINSTFNISFKDAKWFWQYGLVNSNIKAISVPEDYIDCATTAFAQARNLIQLTLPSNWHISLNLSGTPNLSQSTIIHILQQLKDLTNTSSKSITFDILLKPFITNLYLNDQYNVSNSTEGTSYIELAALKNWTVSFS